MRHTEEGLYNALEKILRDTGRAMDCVELFSYQEVKEHAASANRVSDYLGGMWRKGLLLRLPSSGDTKSKARWMYQIKERAPAGVEGIAYTHKLLVDRPTLLITEAGKTMQIETEHLVILIKQK